MLHSALALAGHVVPVFLRYCGAQPLASSVFSWLRAGSQSSDWFWLPPTTRRETMGSLTDEALARLPPTPMRTTMLWVQLACTAPNHWSNFPNLNPGDPRLLQVFLTPYGSFSGSGSGTVPVVDFAEFYVTGWTGQGQGFNNPCQGNGDDPVPNNDAGYIVGHFIKYVDTLNSGGGGPALCDFNSFGNCVAVLTK